MRDSGSPDTIISRGLARAIGAVVEPTTATFGTLGQAGMTPFEGVVRKLQLHLAPRIECEVDAFVSPDDYCLMLLGNDIFNSSMLRVVGIVADQQYIIVQHGAEVDVVPFQLQPPAERDAQHAASAAAKAVASPIPTREVALPPPPSRASAHPPSNASSVSFEDWTRA